MGQPYSPKYYEHQSDRNTKLRDMKVIAITKSQCPRCVQAKNLLEGDTRVTWIHNETPEAQKLIAEHDLVARTAPVFIIDDTTILESMLRVKMMLDNE